MKNQSSDNKGELQQFNNLVLFQAENGKVNIDVYFQDETLRPTKKRIAKLFEVDRSVITKHLKNIFTTNELDENSLCANFAHTHCKINDDQYVGNSDILAIRKIEISDFRISSKYYYYAKRFIIQHS